MYSNLEFESRHPRGPIAWIKNVRLVRDSALSLHLRPVLVGLRPLIENGIEDDDATDLLNVDEICFNVEIDFEKFDARPTPGPMILHVNQVVYAPDVLLPHLYVHAAAAIATKYWFHAHRGVTPSIVGEGHRLPVSGDQLEVHVAVPLRYDCGAFVLFYSSNPTSASSHETRWDGPTSRSVIADIAGGRHFDASCVSTEAPHLPYGQPFIFAGCVWTATVYESGYWKQELAKMMSIQPPVFREYRSAPKVPTPEL